MAQLTPEQLAQVEQWAGEGANLNQVQDRLKTEFGITLTYLDARLLMLEVGVKIKDKPKEVPKPAEPEAPPPPADETEVWPEEDAAAPETSADAAPGLAPLKLTADQIAIPGALISGKVTFSDGQTASWYLDQMGRLGLGNVAPGYQPPKADIPAFQRELDVLLQRSGF